MQRAVEPSPPIRICFSRSQKCNSSAHKAKWVVRERRVRRWRAVHDHDYVCGARVRNHFAAELTVEKLTLPRLHAVTNVLRQPTDRLGVEAYGE
jgi:hypothetical protein